eukprot:TRINITY_DN4386_c0_g1_i2.p1 TRINITY_DN4386_c0_g1~~TRINITY_DN4386_c0_g1_i2.p1  ORF type:complete len:374 (+),score=53.81 TRINITY_DN4386_c0_g1_i2:2-1123(+)
MAQAETNLDILIAKAGALKFEASSTPSEGLSGSDKAATRVQVKPKKRRRRSKKRKTEQSPSEIDPNEWISKLDANSGPDNLREGLSALKQLRRLKRYDDAAQLGEHLCGMIEASSHPKLAADVMVVRADVLECNGNYASALKLYHEALVLQEKEFGLEHSSTTKTALKLAALESHQSSYLHHALKHFKEALQLKHDCCGEMHPSTAATLASMADVMCQQGDIDQAIECIRRCLRIRIKHPNLGAEHSLTADAVSQLAHAYRLDSQNEQALEYYRWALTIRIKALGPNARATADTHFNVALLHRRLGEHDMSAKEFRKAAVAFTAIYGAEHPEANEALQQAEKSDQLKNNTWKGAAGEGMQPAEVVLQIDDSSV